MKNAYLWKVFPWYCSRVANRWWCWSSSYCHLNLHLGEGWCQAWQYLSDQDTKSRRVWNLFMGSNNVYTWQRELLQNDGICSQSKPVAKGRGEVYQGEPKPWGQPFGRLSLSQVSGGGRKQSKLEVWYRNDMTWRLKTLFKTKVAAIRAVKLVPTVHDIWGRPFPRLNLHPIRFCQAVCLLWNSSLNNTIVLIYLI